MVKPCKYLYWNLTKTYCTKRGVENCLENGLCGDIISHEKVFWNPECYTPIDEETWNDCRIRMLEAELALKLEAESDE